MINKKQTSKKVAHDSGKLLEESTSKIVKEVAATAVSRAHLKKKAKPKK